MIRIPKDFVPALTMSDYFRNRIERDRDWPVLPVRAERCPDCAITTGFYTPIAQDLKKEPEEIRRAISEKWFCHDSPDCACRGNWELQGFEVRS